MDIMRLIEILPKYKDENGMSLVPRCSWCKHFISPRNSYEEKLASELSENPPINCRNRYACCEQWEIAPESQAVLREGFNNNERTNNKDIDATKNFNGINTKQKYAILKLVYTLLLSTDCSENDNKVILPILQALNVDKSFGGIVDGNNIPWSKELTCVLALSLDEASSIVSELANSTKEKIKSMLLSIAKNDNVWDRLHVIDNIFEKTNINY